MKEREPEDDPLERRRGTRRVWPTLALALGALAALYLGGWLISGAHFSNAIDRLRAQGEPVRPSDMLPKLRPGERNAADVYEQAFAIAPAAAVDRLLSTANPPWTGQNLALAKGIVMANQRYYELLDEASHLDTCAFPGGWDAVSDIQFTAFHNASSAAKALRVKAQMQVQAGDLDGALASCGTVLRIADHVEQTPSPVALVYAWTTRLTALDQLSRALSVGDPSPDACDRLAGQLATTDYRALLIRSLKFDRAWQLVVARWMESGEWFRHEQPRSVGNSLRTAYPVVAKPLWNVDKQRYLEAMAAYLEAARRPWPEAGKEVLRLDEEAGRQSQVSSVGASDLAPAEAGSFAMKGQDAAMAGAWQIALAFKAYHHDHHTYPATLAELEKATWKLPRDPFTQQPYRYRRSGTGFVVWSVGFDGKDNGGRRFTGPPEEALKPGTDFVLGLPR